MRHLLYLSSLILICALLLSLASCSVPESPEEADLLIVTTIFPQYDFSRQITKGVDGVRIDMLLPPGNESHDYEPSIGDIALVGKADMVICVGGETDAWIYNVIEASESNATVLRLTDMVPLFEEETDMVLDGSHSHDHDHEEHHHEGESEDHDHSAYDEHVWTSPENAAIITEAIAEELARLSEENRSIFLKNAASYAAALRDVQAEMNLSAVSSESKTLIFADRFPFRYLAESLGLTCYAAFPGCSSDAEPSLEAVYRLTSEAKENGVTVVFTTEFSSKNAADIISDEAGCALRELHSCHNVSKEDFENGITCLDLMKRNSGYLKEALCTD